MIESVGTSSVQASALRVTSQSVATSAAASQQEYPQLVSLRIRVDAQLNKAILEIRSNDTGEVVQQYPSAAQIRAFQRAAQIQAAEQKERLEQQQAQNATVRNGPDKSAGFTETKVNASQNAQQGGTDSVKLPTFQPQAPQPQPQAQKVDITPAPQQPAPQPAQPQASAPAQNSGGSSGSTSIVV